MQLGGMVMGEDHPDLASMAEGLKVPCLPMEGDPPTPHGNSTFLLRPSLLQGIFQ